MDIQNLSWDLFKKTGSIDAYLEYRASVETDKKREFSNGKCQCKGDSSSSGKLW